VLDNLSAGLDLAYRRKFASCAGHLVLGCGQIALSSRDAILDYTPGRIAGWGSGMALDAGTAIERPILRPHRNYFTLRSIAASADIKHRFRNAAKACCVPILVLLVIAALGPEKWAPRTHLGWQFDHFIGYFGITLFFCVAWPRPFLIGGVFAAIAALLECLQAFTPDRSAYLPAIFYGAAGALAAALIAELVVRVWRWRRKNPRSRGVLAPLDRFGIFAAYRIRVH
jgi:VanZ family protein